MALGGLRMRRRCLTCWSWDWGNLTCCCRGPARWLGLGLVFGEWWWASGDRWVPELVHGLLAGGVLVVELG